ncbi:MAG: MotB family protein [Gammaproteobacteria bacterium]|nr:MotB family protein [Gammaproteobacteria bacterium]
MSDEAIEKKCPPGGAPAWMATFADLMSLLLCFFVLLLSFSEMDALKFKQLAGSMRDSFGVQERLKAQQIPKGTSVIAMHFSPGKPVPVKIELVVQEASTQTKITSKFTEAQSKNQKSVQLAQSQVVTDAQKKQQEAIKRIQSSLKQEIKKGTIEVIGKNQEIIIRINEKGSFPSGSAKLNKGFGKIMKKISYLTKTIPGDIVISGHTDNVPIYTYLFRSNWELSSSRSVSVLKSILQYQKIDPKRLSVAGHADTIPLSSNKTAAGRAKNRRVEIKIRQVEIGPEVKIIDAVKQEGKKEK